MATFSTRKVSMLCVVFFAAFIANCSTDLRRNDLEGRPCPCLPNYDEQWRGKSCTCVRHGSNDSGGVAGNSGLGEAGTSRGGATTGNGGQVGSGGTKVSGGSGGKDSSGGGNSGGQLTTVGGTTAGGDSTTTGGTTSMGGTPISSEIGGSSSVGGTMNGTASTCPSPREPPSVYSCVPPCTSCVGGICAVNCGANGCTGELTCTSGMPCEVTCSGNKSCNSLTVHCPAGYPCTVICSGKNSCNGLTVGCTADGPCALNCTETTSDCITAKLSCSTGRCQATCGTNLKPTVQNCELSCQQVGCGC